MDDRTPAPYRDIVVPRSGWSDAERLGAHPVVVLGSRSADRSRFTRVCVRLAARHNLPADWLNDAVKGLLPGKDPNARECFQSRGISVSVPSPHYLLALKVAAARVDRDADDIRALATICGLTTAGAVLAVTERVMGSRANLLPKVRFLVEEMFPRCGALTRSGSRCKNPRGSCPHH